VHALTAGQPIHVVFMSSVMHELPEPGEEFETVVRLLCVVGSMIHPSGCMVLRDPAKPRQSSLRYVLALSKDSGPAQRMPNLVLPPRFADVSYSELLRIFEAEFFKRTEDFPFRDDFTCHELLDMAGVRYVELSARMLREFLQKRTFCADEVTWQTEMYELNCRFNVEELALYAQEAGVFAHAELATWREAFPFVQLRPNEGLQIHHTSDQGRIPPVDQQGLSQQEQEDSLPSHVGGFLWREVPRTTITTPDQLAQRLQSQHAAPTADPWRKF